jgi:hypothetical protein
MPCRILTGARPTPHEDDSRHTLIVALPLALPPTQPQLRFLPLPIFDPSQRGLPDAQIITTSSLSLDQQNMSRSLEQTISSEHSADAPNGASDAQDLGGGEANAWSSTDESENFLEDPSSERDSDDDRFLALRHMPDAHWGGERVNSDSDGSVSEYHYIQGYYPNTIYSVRLPCKNRETLGRLRATVTPVLPALTAPTYLALLMRRAILIYSSHDELPKNWRLSGPQPAQNGSNGTVAWEGLQSSFPSTSFLPCPSILSIPASALPVPSARKRIIQVTHLS